MNQPAFTKLMVANRGEIAIRVFRSAHELGIRTVAIYSHADRYSLHRTKAEETYEIGKPAEPVRSYLDIEAIVSLAKKQQVDAIHPGYGFLSENPDLARACEKNGIAFIGPRVDILEQLGDKILAREIAARVGVPTISGSNGVLHDVKQGQDAAAALGYPVILKAAKGGGGRGMRIVQQPEDFDGAFEQAQREAEMAFGSLDLFLEKYLANARHVEVQLLGDCHGNLVHLYERDCSFQRRHQKVIEIAPAPRLDPPELREQLLEAAMSIGKAVKFNNAGTVEFLIDLDAKQFYFIEVNPRIQVEHTVTEQITGIDIVKAQILIAAGHKLNHDEIGISTQAGVKCHGYALQCRITTEDPANNFRPDYGRISHYRSAGGMGIRLDAGSAFSGSVVTPFYDSLLVKVTAWDRRFDGARKRVERALQEFRVRGVKTNIPFLLKLLNNRLFLDGQYNTRIIDETPELYQYEEQKDRASHLLKYIAEVIVNGNDLVKDRPLSKRRIPATVPEVDTAASPPPGTKQRFVDLGLDGFLKWIHQQDRLLITDTTFRDAHQSLLATRMRTYDMLKIADVYAHHAHQLFSLEMWGGATFDTSLRFLKECPWQRLADLRERIPNILFQMLLRASNAVGYTNYSDNVVEAFVVESADAGIDVFRVFDALNGLDNMRVAIDAVRNTPALCEAAICYTGDILDPRRTKYGLKYYVGLAKQLKHMGAHILGIKDMAGLCKPYAARKLVETLKQEIGIPIHFHTHDTSGLQSGSILQAAEVQLDIADAAMAPLSGGTSQPNLNTLAAALRNTARDTALDTEYLDKIAEYWREVRQFYTPFESPVFPAGANLYRYEMPGGQYTNLYQQACALGLGDRWSEVCNKYAEVNELLGDIVKVTPTSKVVGDLALFMLSNNLSSGDVLDESRNLAFPQSVIDLLAGRMGENSGGFPAGISRCVLKGTAPLTGRPGETLPPADLDRDGETAVKLRKLLGRAPSRRDILSSVLYPKVHEDYTKHLREYGNTSYLPTPTFFYGLEPNEEIAVEIDPGKTLIVRYIGLGDTQEDGGKRTVFFELNGHPRQVAVDDRNQKFAQSSHHKADPADPSQIGAAMPGMVVAISVQPGDRVVKGQKMFLLEAMKMETAIHAERDGIVKGIHVRVGSQVKASDLLSTIDFA